MNLEGIKDILRSNNNPFLLCGVKQSSKCGIQSSYLVLLRGEEDTSMTRLHSSMENWSVGDTCPQCLPAAKIWYCQISEALLLQSSEGNPFPAVGMSWWNKINWKQRTMSASWDKDSWAVLLKMRFPCLYQLELYVEMHKRLTLYVVQRQNYKLCM